MITVWDEFIKGNTSGTNGGGSKGLVQKKIFGFG